MNLVSRKGFAPHISGYPVGEIIQAQQPAHIAIQWDSLGDFHPLLAIEKGDFVKTGAVVVTDKQRPFIKLVSPGTGILSEIVYGARNIIEQLIISLDKKEAFVEFPAIKAADLMSLDRQILRQRLIESGLWACFKQLPYQQIPFPETIPQRVIISLDSNEPFCPSSHHYLCGQINALLFGIEIVKKLANNRVIVTAYTTNPLLNNELSKIVTHRISGNYPAGDAVVTNFHTRKTIQDNQSWIISGTDVLAMGRFLLTGRYPTEVLVGVGGPASLITAFVQTRYGAPVSVLFDKQPLDISARYIAGGLFRGRSVTRDCFLKREETSVIVLPEENSPQFLGFMRLGKQCASFSKAFLSKLNLKPLLMTTGMHGIERACINCGLCSAICPVNLLPQFLYKAILLNHLDEAIDSGLLDCCACGLCTFACPCKIEIGEIFKQAKKSWEIKDL